MFDIENIDISEDGLLDLSEKLLPALLRDNTLSNSSVQHNIKWATKNYEVLGVGFEYDDEITVASITGQNGKVIVPRAAKSREQQQQRSREMAEVFTPSWICNKQNNLIDAAWFGRENVFNVEIDDANGTHTWEPTIHHIVFPKGKTWNNYVNENRLEITCGEAPYLVSRYDSVTGEAIPLKKRIGLLDRKMRIICENVPNNQKKWMGHVRKAYMSVYGYDWQGDNVLLAREALLVSFMEYYKSMFNDVPSEGKLLSIAKIISWNIWQMDGLKGVLPNSCHGVPDGPNQLEGLADSKMLPCPGCKTGDITRHTGIYALTMDWTETKNHERAATPIRFIDLIKN